MSRIVALDFGTKRTGIAVSDPLRIIASPLETVATHKVIEYLKKYFEQNNVSIIVVGLPLQMDGTPSESFRHIKPFVEKLKKEFPEMAVEYYDERFTSVLAQRAMIESGMKKMQRRDKATVDMMSAAIILRDYMASMKKREQL